MFECKRPNQRQNKANKKTRPGKWRETLKTEHNYQKPKLEREGINLKDERGRIK